MLTVEFDYPVNNKLVQVIAKCKSITDSYEVQDLSIEFLDKDRERMKVSYDKDLFGEIELEALFYLAEEYYNGQLNFQQGH